MLLVTACVMYVGVLMVAPTGVFFVKWLLFRCV